MVYRSINKDRFLFLRTNRDSDFVHPHFARHSIRETFSSPTFAVLFPFFLGRAPSAARIPPLSLPLSLFLNLPFALRSILTLLQRRRVISFLFLVRVRRSRCHPPRPPREEKKRVWNPAGIVNAPLSDLSRDSSSSPSFPPLLNRLISAGKMNGSINTSSRVDHRGRGGPISRPRLRSSRSSLFVDKSNVRLIKTLV